MLPPFHFYYKKDKLNEETAIEIISKTIFKILKSDIIKYAKELLKEMRKNDGGKK